jgi:hypothetical protein
VLGPALEGWTVMGRSSTRVFASSPPCALG